MEKASSLCAGRAPKVPSKVSNGAQQRAEKRNALGILLRIHSSAASMATCEREMKSEEREKRPIILSCKRARDICNRQETRRENGRGGTREKRGAKRPTTHLLRVCGEHRQNEAVLGSRGSA